MRWEHWLYRVPLLIRSLFRRREVEREMDDELADHLEREIAWRVQRGQDRDQAERAARIALGGLEQQKEAVRDARGVRPLEDLGADVAYSFRALGRAPGFTATAVLVLGLGLGALATAYCVVDAVLLSQLPYPEADRLVRVYQRFSPTNLGTLSVVDVQALARQQRSFTAFGAVRWSGAALAGAGAPERIAVGWVSAGFFDALGITAAHGRLLRAADEEAAAPAVVVIAHSLAERAFESPAAALGRAVTLDGLSHVVVGVLPAGRDELAGMAATAWPVLRLAAPTRRGPFGLRGYGRLRPGVSLDAATADLAAISERIFPLWAAGFQDRSARLFPVSLRTTIVGTAERSLRFFGLAVALVWLIALANVGTLVLVRTAAREQELAVRAALGASTARVVRLVATECAAVALLAGLAGWGFTVLGVRLVAAFAPDLPRLAEVGIDARTAGFLALAGLVSAILVGVSPLAQVLRRRGTVALAPDRRRVGTSRESSRLRAAFVVAEFALALPLLLGAALLFKSFLRLQQVDPGFDPASLGSVSLSLPAARYPDDDARQAFWRRLLASVEPLPGVAAAGLTTSLPPDNGGDVNNFDLVARPVPQGTMQPVAPWIFVNDELFAAMKVPLLDGRMFTPADVDPAPPVVLVSRAWAARHFPGQSVLGQQMISGGCTSCPLTTVIGVVGDVHYLGLDTSPEAVYQPLAPGQTRSASLVVRTRGAPAPVLAAIRAEVARLDPSLPVVESPLRERLHASLADPRRQAGLLAAFAGVAVLLAGIGTFGLMSYVVRQRRREIGVRIALGARPSHVTRWIVAAGLRHALLGTAVGLVLAALQARWLRGLLFEVGPGDPVGVIAAALALLSAALLACWLPARRAGQVRALEAIGAD